MEAAFWKVIGASLIGKGHEENNLPCQDAHLFEKWTDTSGVVVLSDGAGSSAHSHLGSRFIVEKTIERIRPLFEKHKWLEKDKESDAETWSDSTSKLIYSLQKDLKDFATKESLEYKSLSCTMILLLYSPHKLLVAHVGDGRAGYADKEGKWHSIMVPFKGEQVGQTIFLTSDLHAGSEGVLIRTNVVKDEITAFTLMSDGCELACWKCYDKYPDEERYYDPNLPDQGFFEQNINALKSMHYDQLPNPEIEKKWSSFLKDGNMAFSKETDDKTMILGALMMEKELEEKLNTNGD